MTWVDRLAKSIILISPQGTEFEASWRSSDRTKEKSLGSFKAPKRKGTIIQDLDVGGDLYNFAVIFDGEDHDIISDLFYQALSENGSWDVNHPIHGLLILQLISVTQRDEPVDNGNQTVFTLSWIVPLDEDNLVSDAELAQEIQAQLTQLNEVSTDQLEEIAKQDSVSKIEAIKAAASSTMALIQEGLATITELSADISRINNQIQRALTTDLLAPVVALGSLATQIQQAAQTPALATNAVQSRFNTYLNLIGILSIDPPENPTPENLNQTAVRELSITGVVSTLPLIVSTGDLQTRTQAVELAALMSDTFDSMTDNLDAVQEVYINNNLSTQYFSQSSSYADMQRIISLGIKFLLTAAFELKIEKRFFLKSDRTPIDVTISEYKTLGENDENLDLFIESNDLMGEELLLLRSGREVRVYV